MAQERWERLAAATGIGFVVLAAIGLLVAPIPPEPGAPPQDVVSYFTGNADRLRLQAFILGLAGVLFLWFLGSLRSYLRQAEGDTGRLSAVAYAGGIAAFVSFGVGTGISTALAHRVAAQAEASVSLALHEVATFAITGTAFPVIVLFAATSLVSGRTKTLPAWLGWFGWLVVIVALVSAAGVFYEEGAFAPGGIFGYVFFGVFLLWFLAASVILTQRAGRPTT